jgi:hypothetical protein
MGRLTLYSIGRLTIGPANDLISSSRFFLDQLCIAGNASAWRTVLCRKQAPLAGGFLVPSGRRADARSGPRPSPDKAHGVLDRLSGCQRGRMGGFHGRCSPEAILTRYAGVRPCGLAGVLSDIMLSSRNQPPESAQPAWF